MTRDPFSDVASRQRLGSFENVERRRGGRSPRARWATAFIGAALAVATAQLAVGCAEEAEEAPLPIAVESEPGIRRVRVKPPSEPAPSEDPQLDGRQLRLQRKRDWWNRAREVLFSDIELSAEQLRAVDAIIESQLNTRAQLQQLDTEIRTARKARDAQRIGAAHREFRALKKQLDQPHEIYEKMRAVLAEEQRPAFDMNRARHVAAIKESGRIDPGERAEQAEKP